MANKDYLSNAGVRDKEIQDAVIAIVKKEWPRQLQEFAWLMALSAPLPEPGDDVADFNRKLASNSKLSRARKDMLEFLMRFFRTISGAEDNTSDAEIQAKLIAEAQAEAKALMSKNGANE